MQDFDDKNSLFNTKSKWKVDQYLRTKVLMPNQVDLLENIKIRMNSVEQDDNNDSETTSHRSNQSKCSKK